MSLLFIDGFDAKDTLTKWQHYFPSGPGGLSYGATTRFGTGYAVSTAPTDSGGYGVIRTFTASSQVFVGAAVQSGYGGFNYGPPFHILAGDQSATFHLYLMTNNLGAVQLWRGDGHSGSISYPQWVPNGTMLATSSNGVLNPSIWRYVEMSATIDSSVGTVQVRVDGTQVINFTGNTRNGGTSATIDTFMINSLSLYYTTFNIFYPGSPVYDDLYVCNSLGSTNNTFLGDVRVQTLMPNAAGSSTQLTPTGSANNYANVSEVPDNIATYNASSTIGQRDTYALPDLLATTGSVFGVQQIMTAMRADAGSGSIKTAQKSGATISYGPVRSLGAAPNTYVEMYEQNPATSSAYTVSQVNGLEAGAEIA